jgi:hypothetical protein
MNEIYDKKANKYKYKYLKLKNDYIGGSGVSGYVTKYAIQGTQKNKWFKSNDMLYLFISLNNINKNKGSVAKYNDITYIYNIKDNKKYIINFNTKMEYQIYELRLPRYKKPEKIDVTEINELITNDEINIINIINNDYNDNDNLYYTLYHSEKDVFEWNASENWQKNMLSMFLKNINDEHQNHQNHQLIIHLNKSHYLLFKYNNTNYISYIFKNDTYGANSIEFIILNLITGESTYISCFKSINHNGIKLIDDRYLTYIEQLIKKIKIPDLNNDQYIQNIKEVNFKKEQEKREQEEREQKEREQEEREQEKREQEEREEEEYNKQVKLDEEKFQKERDENEKTRKENTYRDNKEREEREERERKKKEQEKREQKIIKPRTNDQHNDTKEKLIENINENENNTNCKDFVKNYTNICSTKEEERNIKYKQMIKSYHPDKNTNCFDTADKIFKDLQNAYDTCKPSSS